MHHIFREQSENTGFRNQSLAHLLFHHNIEPSIVRLILEPLDLQAQIDILVLPQMDYLVFRVILQVAKIEMQSFYYSIFR